MKSPTLGITCCESLYSELKNFNFDELITIIKPYPINCYTKKYDEIEAIVEELKSKCEKVIILLSFCSSQLEYKYSRDKKVFLYKKNSCIEYLISKCFINKYVKEGYLIINQFWLNNWEYILTTRLGFNNIGDAINFIKNSIKKILLIKHNESPDTEKKIKEIQTIFSVPVETILSDSEYFYSIIENILLKIQLKLEKESNLIRTARLLREASDYMFAFDFFKKLNTFNKEDDLISKTIDLVNILFEPKNIDYYRLIDNNLYKVCKNNLLHIHQTQNNKINLMEIEKILDFSKDSDVLIQFTEKDQITDFLYVKDVKFKEYIKYYNEFSNILSKVVSIALSNIRKINELIIAKQVAEEANKAKSIFLSSMSHELRTPLNAIIGLSELLKDMVKDKDQLDYVNKILYSSNVLLNLINDILDFSKIEAGHLSLSYNEFILDELLSKLKVLFEPKVAEKGLNFYIEIEPDVPFKIISDELRLSQVLMNLLSNAVKFTEKGYVYLKVELLEKFNSSQARIKFSVKDTGIGISQEKIKKLFKPFTQADNTISKKYGGTGLGLAISSKLVTAMGGNISVESIEGRGSTFFFDIICEVKDWKPPINDVKLDKTHVLIVEDDEITKNILKSFLQRYNFHSFDEASFGHEALQKIINADINDQQYNIIFLDYFLPDMNANQLLNKLIELNSTQKIKKIPSNIIMLSVIEPHQIDYNRELVKQFIHKPLTYSSIYNAILSLNSNILKTEQKENIEEKFIKLKVLVAEDNPINQELIKKILEKFGIESDIAWNGKEAVKFFEENRNKYDLILLDINMPEMNGLEAAKLIREIDKNIPILALTAAATVEDKNMALEAGMNDFLTKPIQTKELFEKIKAYVTNHSIIKISESTDSSNNIIDLNALYSILEDEEKVKLILKKFYLQLTEGDFKDITQKLKNKSQDVERLFHTLKGTTGMAKINLLFNISKTIYEKLQKNIDISEEEINNLENTLNITINKLKEILSENENTTNENQKYPELKNNEFFNLFNNILKELEAFSPVQDDDINILINEISRRNLLTKCECDELKSYIENFDFNQACNILKKINLSNL